MTEPDALTCRDVRRLASSYLDSELASEARSAVDAHLASCRRCSAEVSSLRATKELLQRLGSEPMHAASRLRALETFRAWHAGRRDADDSAEAEHLFAQLWSYPPSQRILLVRNSKKFHERQLCELLLARSAAALTPSQAAELAELAVELAQCLPSTLASATQLLDLRARCYGLLATARRLEADLTGSEAALAQAERLAGDAGASRPRTAGLLRLKTALRAAQGDEVEALALIDEAIALLTGGEDLHELGGALLDKAEVLSKLERPDEAIELATEGLALLDGRREPRRALEARVELAALLESRGRADEAIAALDAAQALRAGTDDGVLLMRMRWLRVKLLVSRGNLAEAQSLFLEMREQFEAKGIAVDLALTSLDLGVIYLTQKEIVSLKELATEMVAAFRSLGVAREMIAALAILQQAAELERVSMGLIAKISRYLRSARQDPPLPFQLPSPDG